MYGQIKRKFIILPVIGLGLLAITACAAGAGEPIPTLAAPADSDTDLTTPTDAADTPSPAATEVVRTATPEPTTPPTETATLEPTPEPTSTATAVPTDTAPSPTETAEPPAAARASVSIEDFQFTPGNLTVQVGTTVVWTNNGNARHTVTADDGSFGSSTLSSGDVFEFTFTTAGTYGYYCRFHGGPGNSGMSAIITVTQ